MRLSIATQRDLDSTPVEVLVRRSSFRPPTQAQIARLAAEAAENDPNGDGPADDNYWGAA